MNRKPLFTITVYTENQVGLLNQITIIFTRRGLNIESISASPSSIPGVHKYTITSRADRDALQKAVMQIQKRIDVLQAFLLTDDEIVYRELALYKVPTDRLLDEPDLETILRRHNARILEMTRDYTIIETTGHSSQTQALLDVLKDYGILQFVRSGRVAVTRSPIESLNLFIEEQERRRIESETTQSHTPDHPYHKS